MGYSTETLNFQIAQLTNPEHGLVDPADESDFYRLRAPIENDSSLGDKLVVITGPSRAGKDTIVDALVDLGGYARVRTATTRPRRENETPDAFTWMRERFPHETFEEYTNALVREYGLVEHDPHHDDVYGLPRVNLDEAGQDKIPLLNVDTRGIRTLRQKLVGERAITSILICPENAEILEARMGQLDHKSSARLETAQQYLREAPGCVDYIYHNLTAEDVSLAAIATANQIHRIVNNSDALASR
jgi:guanylate kinase